jgi:hypothetical protein
MHIGSANNGVQQSGGNVVDMYDDISDRDIRRTNEARRVHAAMLRVRTLLASPAASDDFLRTTWEKRLAGQEACFNGLCR